MRSRRDVLDALDQLVQAVARAQGSDEAQALMSSIEASGEGVLSELVAYCLQAADQKAADFLALSVLLANDPELRQRAAAAGAELAGRGLKPRCAFLACLRQKRYLTGYVASEGQGRGHRLLTLWRRERGLAQAYLFRLDAEGALVGFEASRNLSVSQVEELTCSGGVRVSLKDAAGLVRRGLSVARAKGIEPPADYARQHRLVEEHIFGK